MPRDVRARVKVRLYNNLAHEYVHAQTYRYTALNVAKKALNALIYVAFFVPDFPLHRHRSGALPDLCDLHELPVLCRCLRALGPRAHGLGISTVTRPKPFLSAELCWSRSSGRLRTRSAVSSRIWARHRPGKNECVCRARRRAGRGSATTRCRGRAAAQGTRGCRAADCGPRKVMRLARNDAQVRRFMTAPGVGPITALCFLATIDDPTRFKRSRSVGAYVGLTTRRYASGEIDWTGRISKCGDAMLRS